MQQNLWRITLDTNPEDCNLKCVMCEEHSAYSTFKKQLLANSGISHRRMPSEWLESILSQAKTLGVKEIIPSTMGEPLLYGHMDLLLELAGKYNIKINLTTNGSFPRKSVEQWANIILPLASDTKFSVNGATADVAEKVMPILSFRQQMANIRQYIAIRNKIEADTGYRSTISFQLTFMTNNMHQLPQIIEMAYEMGIDRIKGHHLWVHFPETKHLAFTQNYETAALWNSYVQQALEKDREMQMKTGNKIKLESIVPLPLTHNQSYQVNENSQCPFLGKELWISATGKISPCCAPDHLREQLGNFGNIQTHVLGKVMQSKEYNFLLHNYQEQAVCKTCPMRK